MRRALSLPAALVTALLFQGGARAGDRVRLSVDASEAEAVLALATRSAAGEALSGSDWARLFSSEPYRRLKKREASMKRDFTDEEFRAFVLSPELVRKAPALSETLAAWTRADLAAAAERVLAYLPADAVIRAKVYPVIKPKENSFVFEAATDPAIFLALDPGMSAARFENTVAHELHHIGFSSVDARMEKTLDGADPALRRALEWAGAFGEGFAMLAAAGSPDVHPHAASPASDRERWDRDMQRFDEDLRSVERFLLDVAEGRLKSDEEIRERGFSFFGVQGPWYTVGYRMAATIERQEGRAAVVEAFTDPRRLFAAWNRVASRLPEPRPALWSDELLRKIAAIRTPRAASRGTRPGG